MPERILVHVTYCTQRRCRIIVGGGWDFPRIEDRPRVPPAKCLNHSTLLPATGIFGYGTCTYAYHLHPLGFLCIPLFFCPVTPHRPTKQLQLLLQTSAARRLQVPQTAQWPPAPTRTNREPHQPRTHTVPPTPSGTATCRRSASTKAESSALPSPKPFVNTNAVIRKRWRIPFCVTSNSCSSPLAKVFFQFPCKGEKKLHQLDSILVTSTQILDMPHPTTELERMILSRQHIDE